MTLLSSNANAGGNICVTGQGCGNANADLGDYDKTFYVLERDNFILNLENGDKEILNPNFVSNPLLFLY